MNKTTKDPSDYLESLPEAVRTDMQQLDKKISNIMKGEPRVLWEGVFWGGSEQKIIGYGDLVYKRPKGNVEWFTIGLALQKNYISLYIMATEDGEYVVKKYAKELGKVKTGSSSISFAKLEDLNLDLVLKLIAVAKAQARLLS